ncbi:MAG: exodeoxyribonuclease V subunit gamma, partial [Chitinophagaceae bacterium]
WYDDANEKLLARWRKKGKDAALIKGHPLLTNWGAVLQDTFYLLFQHEDLINAYEECYLSPPTTQTLLGKIQEDLFYSHREKNSPLELSALADGSFTISACYTPAREVEALYNYLVKHVDEGSEEGVSPRDIVVMVSDIDAYAPYIRAVFDTAPYSFPYTIADEKIDSSDSAFAALEALLRLHDDNFTAEAVLQLLDFTSIRERFGIQELTLIRKAVSSAAFRFGMEGKNEDDSVYLSCSNALRRLMFGICMSGDEPHSFGDHEFYPVEMVEGSDALPLVRFCHFAEVLMASIKERAKARSVAEWGVYVEGVINNFLFREGEEGKECALLLRQVEKTVGWDGLLEEEVSYEVFTFSFLKTLGNETRQHAYVSKGITFCSLIPMRSIPFKVVALLGMNMGQFPRNEALLGFNLMERERRRGDRHVKANDKQLFLDTLLSAQEKLYISYIGRSSKDNSLIPPSSLVDELLNYLEDRTAEPELVRKTLVVEHPLHSFSKKYN